MDNQTFREPADGWNVAAEQVLFHQDIDRKISAVPMSVK